MHMIWNVYVCVNFGDEILLRGKECKTRVNLNFSGKGKTVNCRYSIGYRPEILYISDDEIDPTVGFVS